MGTEESSNSEARKNDEDALTQNNYLDVEVQGLPKTVLTLPASVRDVCARISVLSKATKRQVSLSPAVVDLQKQARAAMNSGVYKTMAAVAKTASKNSPVPPRTLMKMSKVTICCPDVYKPLNGSQVCSQLLIKGGISAG